MAKEYIDREALYKFLCEQQEPITGAYSRGRNDGLNVAKSAIHNRQITPAADVAPVAHGRWVLDDYGCHCDICGRAAMDYSRTKYCPNCGAKMDGGTK